VSSEKVSDILTDPTSKEMSNERQENRKDDLATCEVSPFAFNNDKVPNT
jgi:hypothetical protein